MLHQLALPLRRNACVLPAAAQNPRQLPLSARDSSPCE